MKHSFRLSCKRNLIATAVLLLALPAFASQQPAQGKEKIPVLDGGAGSCSADFTVTDAKGQPVRDAKVRVHIAYGFMGAHKLDLEVGTNGAGKARFTGLPAKFREPVYFHAVKGDQEGSAFYDPDANCHAQHDIVLQKADAGAQTPPAK